MIARSGSAASGMKVFVLSVALHPEIKIEL
jgi:hypothetical protein